MPSEHAIDVEQRLVRIRMWGTITRAEIMAIRRRVADDPRFGSGYSELIDLQDLTSTVDITTADVRALASSSSTVDPVLRRAFITTDAATFGLARMFEAYRSMHRGSEQIEVFSSAAAAEAWLAGWQNA